MEVVVEGMRAKKSNKIFGFFGGGGQKKQGFDFRSIHHNQIF